MMLLLLKGPCTADHIQSTRALSAVATLLLCAGG